MKPMEAAWTILKEETLQDMMGDENPQGQMSQAMAAARMPREKKPLNLQSLPPMQEAPMPTQTKLPQSLVQGAQVGDKPFDQLDFSNVNMR